jgi:hypothetical protein
MQIRRCIVKKGWILIAMMLLSACGGVSGDNGAVNGSGNGGSGSGGGGSDAGTVPTATVALVVNRSGSAEVSAMKAMMAPPAATNARISITNPNVNGISYKQIQNLPIPSTTLLTVPIASGYSFELVTYYTATFNFIESYATTTGVIISAGSNTVTLTLNPIAVTLNYPATLSTAQSYTVDFVSSLTPTPLLSVWRLKAQTTPYTTPLHLSGHVSSVTQNVLVAPVNNNQPGTVYFQGEFYLKSSMLNTGELYTNWVFVYPNPLWGDAALSAILSVPSGTVTMTL